VAVLNNTQRINPEKSKAKSSSDEDSVSKGLWKIFKQNVALVSRYIGGGSAEVRSLSPLHSLEVSTLVSELFHRR
jgi:hypothetical protein